MITYAYSPWKNTAMTRWRNFLLSLAFIASLIIGYSAMFISNPAQAAQDYSQCSSIAVYGDFQGTGDKSAKLGQRLQQKSGMPVRFNVNNGRNVDAVRKEIEKDKSKIEGSCLIIEAGTADTDKAYSREDNKKAIKKLLDATKGASKVYWVMPVMDNDKASAKHNTKRFNDVLREEIGEIENAQVVGLEDLSLKSRLFQDNGLAMTPSGYNQRVSGIIDHIDNDMPEKKESSSATPPPSNGGSSNGGENSGGGPDSNPYSNDGDAVGGSEKSRYGEDPGIPDNTEDVSAFSPRQYADRALKIADIGEAGRYLSVGRWETPPIPSKQVSLAEPSTLKNVAIGGVGQATLGMAHTGARLTSTMLTWTFSNNLSGLGLSIGDGFYGSFFGSNTGVSVGRTIAFSSAIMMIAIIMGAVNALGVNSMSPRQRMMGFFTAMIKAVVSIVVLVGTSIQSSKNIGGDTEVASIFNQTGGEQWVSELKDSNKKTVDSNFDPDANLTSQVEGNGLEGNFGKRNISEVSSWEPLSLGWIISLMYSVAALIVNAFVVIINTIILTPISYIQNIFSRSDSTANGQEFGKDYETQCDRFVGAMHYTYMNTSAAKSNPGSSQVLLAYDNLFYRFFYRGYETIYGGNKKTASAANSWCWATEVSSRLPAGEWAMLSRGAGLYGIALGSGNLIGSVSGTFASGRLSNQPDNDLNALPGEVGDGKIINAAGDYIDGKDGRTILEIYQGVGRGGPGQNQAKYYFAGCTFPPGSKGELNKEWKNVRAMGKTGGVNGQTKEKVDEIRESDVERGMYLGNEDCIGKDGEEEKNIWAWPGDEGIRGGFGSDPEKEEGKTVERWNYAPVPPPSIAEVFKNGIGSIMPDVPNWLSGDDPEDEDYFNPNNKFGDNKTINPVYGVAYDFWKGNSDSGDAGTSGVPVALFLTSWATFLAFVPFSIFAAIANLMLSFLLATLGFIFLMVMLSFVLKGTVRK